MAKASTSPTARAATERREIAIKQLVATLELSNTHHHVPVADAQIAAAETLIRHGIEEGKAFDTLVAGMQGELGFGYGHKVKAAAIILQATPSGAELAALTQKAPK